MCPDKEKGMGVDLPIFRQFDEMDTSEAKHVGQQLPYVSGEVDLGIVEHQNVSCGEGSALRAERLGGNTQVNTIQGGETHAKVLYLKELQYKNEEGDAVVGADHRDREEIRRIVRDARHLSSE
jgi:hypothetical protein